MSQSYAEDTSARRLVLLEIEKTADRLIKVHGRRAFNHASKKIDVARKKGNEADHVYWMQIAENVKRQRSRYGGDHRVLARASV